MAAVFPIESNIPRPVRSERQELIAALRSMEIGQSVLVAGKSIKQVSSDTRSARLGTGKHFECRTMTNGVRIWRIE
jgi:hypothetical protein